MSVPDSTSWILWVLGTIVSAVGGCFGFSMIRITQVEKNLREDMGAEFDTMRQEHDTQLSGIKRTHERMWAEMARMNQEAERHRGRLSERMAQLPTREEMKSDLAAMEHRIENLLRGTAARH